MRKDVWDLIFANIRFDVVQHDMKAEIGACRVGERRMLALLEKYGRASFEAHKQALFDATRKMMESEIAAIPNGIYSGEGRVYLRRPARGLDLYYSCHHHGRGQAHPV